MESAARINKGNSLGYCGQFSGALQLIHEGLRHLSLDREPHLALAARHNLINLLQDSGAPQKAFSILPEVQKEFKEHGSPLLRTRLRWLEGKILRDLDSFKTAEIAFSQTKEEFIDRELGADTAFLSLDLALLYAKQGLWGKVREVTGEVIPLFDAYRLSRESMVARLLFGRAHGRSPAPRLVTRES